MAYGLRYSSDFDSFQPLLSYRLNIFQKDYTGANGEILLSGNPVIHEWQDDDPKASIKGSTLKISILVNSEDGLSLSDFYSEDDYGWACELRRLETDEVLFQGYLLQDDSQELQVDFTHEIQLTFTDGLGLLKDVTLDQAAVITGVLTNHSVLIGTPPGTLNTITTQDIGLGGLQPGAVFTINDGGLAGTYTVLSISLIPTLGIYDYWIVTNTIIGYTLPYTASIDWIDPYPLTGYVPLIDIYKLCLKATFITCGLNIYSKIYPIGGTNERLLDDTFIQAETFLSSDRWMNCYDILEQINSRFNLSLFQAHGKWNLMRWDELYRYTTNTGANIPCYIYNSNFEFILTGNESNVWIFKKGNDMEVGVLKSINRANQFVKETFNYKNLPLLRNGNNQELGALRNQYDDGPNTILEYDAPYWQENPIYAGSIVFFIRVVRNSATLEEVERYLVIKKTGIFDIQGIYQDVLVDKNDFFTFSQNVRYNDHVTPPGVLPLTIYIGFINLDDGATSYYLNGSTSSFLNSLTYYSYQIWHGDYADTWHTFGLQNVVFLTSGRLRVWLPVGLTPGSADELHLNDLTFSVKNNIVGSGLVNGHTHTDSQSIEIKNNIDKEIGIDVTNRYSIFGSLFLNTYTGFLINKANSFEYPGTSYSYPTLGQHTTQEALFSTYKMRGKYEGKYLYINQEDVMLTILAVFVDNQNYNFFRYAPGRMAIDYKNGHADLSLVEIIDSPTGDFVGPFGSGIEYDYLVWAASRLYEFNYLYEKS